MLTSCRQSAAGNTERKGDKMEILDLTMKWVVAPLLGIVVWLLKRVTSMGTEIKVLETKIEAQGEASRQAHQNLTNQMGQILAKLDGIEAYLRKDIR